VRFVLAGVALVVALAIGAVLAAEDDDAGTATGGCGTKELYGRELEIRVVGRPLPCAQVRRIVAGPCRDGKVWSCFSFRPPDPALVWFRERERFQERYSTAIEAHYPSCRGVRVTRADWARARSTSGFPTLRQVLGDELIRCKLLRRMTRADVIRLLGPSEGIEDKRHLNYEVGPERDSFFQVDSDFLSIEFDRRGVFRRAEYYQG
jgi:hypothetical protein